MRNASMLVVLAGALSVAALVRPAPVLAGSGLSEGAVALHVKQVLLIEEHPAVLLLDAAEERYLLIYVDLFMANAIRMGMLDEHFKRPLTHDLIGTLLDRLGARVSGVTITDLRESTYYALISLQVNGRAEQVDSRPSDALALAVRADAPIFAPADLLTPVEFSHDPHRGEEPPLPPPEMHDVPRVRT